MFNCSRCGEHLDDFLFHSGKRKPVCRICESYRGYASERPHKSSLARHQVIWLSKCFNRLMEARGWKRCPSCRLIKSLSDDFSKTYCRSCTNAKGREWKRANRTPESRLDEHRKNNARRRTSGYSSGAERNADLKEQRRHRRIHRTRACSHVIAYYKWLICEAPECRIARHCAGRPWRNPRLSAAEAFRLRYRLDKPFQVKERLRRQINKARKRDGVAELIRLAIQRKGESRSVKRQLGYTIAQLCEHLEKQFSRGMTWERFLSGDIHIDHIVPQAAFDLSIPEEWRKCWCLSNLRPCWARDNIHKRDKRLYLL